MTEKMICVEFQHEIFGHAIKVLSESEFHHILQTYAFPYTVYEGFVEVNTPSHTL